MDPLLVLNGCWLLLKPLLEKASEKAAETIGEKLAEKTAEKSLWKTIKGLFIIDEEKQIIEAIESKPIANSQEISIIERKVNEEISKNPNFIEELRMSLNINSANEFIVSQIINSIKNAQLELEKLQIKHDMLDEVDRGKYKVRIMDRENDLIDYNKKLINILNR